MQSREKARLYHEFAQLLRAGVTLPGAVQKLLTLTRGASNAALQDIARVLAGGGTVSEALAAPPAFRGLDAAIFAASEKAGRLEQGFAHVSDYYQAMSGARTRVLVKLLYPVFILHLAGFAFSLPLLVMDNGSVGKFGVAFLEYVAVLWAIFFGIVFFCRALARLGAVNTGVDHFLAAVPVIGGLRRALALSRFCMAYDMQLEAGINVMSALDSAGDASASATYRAAAQRAIPDLRAGETLSTALNNTRAFPEPFMRAITIGEDTGKLEDELRRAGGEYRDSAFRRLDLLAEWLPKFALIAVAALIGYKILSFYSGLYRNIGL